MPLQNYGLLKGTVAGHLRDADDDHYQILVHAAGTVHRVACNVKSAAPKAPSALLFQSVTALPPELVAKLKAVPAGFSKLPPKAGGLAMDYVRGGLVRKNAMRPVPPDAPGADNDLKDKLESAAVKAMAQAGSVLYAFGSKWGPEPGRPDQYFKFLPGNGIHDIHMNQGNSGKYQKDNGLWQDGALIFSYPNASFSAFFFAFQSQSFDTDEHGDPRTGDAAASPAGARGNIVPLHAAEAESAALTPRAASRTRRRSAAADPRAPVRGATRRT